MAVRKGLGKGLDSLIPSVVPGTASAAKKKTSSRLDTNAGDQEINNNQNEPIIVEKVVEKIVEKVVEKKAETFVKISMVGPNKEQPRKEFEEDALLELADSIKQFGVLQPILVKKKDDFYEIIAGERRWRAAKMAGLKEIPVIVKEFTDLEVVEVSLIENIQRENLNPIEEALAYKRLLEEFHLKQDEIAEKVSKSRTSITNAVRLLKLDDRVQKMVIDEMLTTGHVRALLAIEDKEKQYNLAMQIFDRKLSVRETEKLVRNIVEPKEKIEKKVDIARSAIYESLEERMKNILGTKVSIHQRSKHKGQIEIEYYSEQELERILDLIQTIQL